jgi:hypothetical protein
LFSQLEELFIGLINIYLTVVGLGFVTHALSVCDTPSLGARTDLLLVLVHRIEVGISRALWEYDASSFSL